MMKKWYSLIDKVYRHENLASAYKRVQRNKGSKSALINRNRLKGWKSPNQMGANAP